MELCQYTQNCLDTLADFYKFSCLDISPNLHYILLAEAAKCACALLQLYSL